MAGSPCALCTPIASEKLPSSRTSTGSDDGVANKRHHLCRRKTVISRHTSSCGCAHCISECAKALSM
eukprot:353299-Chlamydomonas_euryale.AAC.15